MNDDLRKCLVAAARAATVQAYLTKEGGTRYGAAVLARSGAIHSAGQYSSFNHVTNVHAEQGALLMAVARGDADILALAVASTGTGSAAAAGEDLYTRPCGICRQVMLEHAMRIGHDFEVLMARGGGDGYEVSTVMHLLPHAWLSKSAGAGSGGPREERKACPAKVPDYVGEQIEAFDYLFLQDGLVALVWDPAFRTGAVLTKVKYAPVSRGRWWKVSHSFTEPVRYEAELRDLGWDKPTGVGATAAMVRPGEIRKRYPARPIGELGYALPGPIADALGSAGVDMGSILLTGSRATGMQQKASDVDMLVPIAAEKIVRFREHLARSMAGKHLGIPGRSGTWRLLGQAFPGGQERILSELRFTETVDCKGRSYAMILVPTRRVPVLLDDSWKPAGWQVAFGKVVEARQSPYKRSVFTIRQADDAELEVVCYHKFGNLIKEGDQVAVGGWGVRKRDACRLIQFLHHRDRIVWHRGSQ
jgi:cytidine deaminase